MKRIKMIRKERKLFSRSWSTEKAVRKVTKMKH